MVGVLGGATGGMLPGVSPDLLPGSLLEGAQAVVCLIADGLGEGQLRAAIRRGHSRALASLGGGRGLRRVHRTVLTSVFPSSTVPALTTVATGVAPGIHGVVGWITHLPELGGPTQIVRWGPAGRPNGSYEDPDLGGHEPLAFLALDTIHQRLSRAGAESFVLVPREYLRSAFTRMLYAGATFAPYDNARQVVDGVRRILEVREPGQRLLVLAYLPDVDEASHGHGPRSRAHARAVRAVDATVAGLLEVVERTAACRGRGRQLLVVTADHGHVDGVEGQFVDLRLHRGLVDLLEVPPTGERRVTYLHPRPRRVDDVLAYVQKNLGRVADVVAAREAFARGLFGPGEPTQRARRRIGEVVLVARGPHQLVFDHDLSRTPRHQAGDHGALEVQEMLVPLIVVAAGA